MSDDSKKKAADNKGKKAGKDKSKKGKAGKDEAGGEGGAKASGGVVRPSVAGHPRGRAAVRRAKGCAGLGAFAITTYLSWNAGVPGFELLIRALVAGIVAYLLAWFAAVSVWRALVLAELAALREQRLAAAAAAPADPTQFVQGQPAAAQPAARQAVATANTANQGAAARGTPPARPASAPPAGGPTSSQLARQRRPTPDRKAA